MAGIPVPQAIPATPTSPDPTSVKGWKTSLTQFNATEQAAIRHAMAAKTPPITTDAAINAQLVEDVKAADILSKAYHVFERQYGQVKSDGAWGREDLNHTWKNTPVDKKHQIYGAVLTDYKKAIELAGRVAHDRAAALNQYPYLYDAASMRTHLAAIDTWKGNVTTMENWETSINANSLKDFGYTETRNPADPANPIFTAIPGWQASNHSNAN